MKISLSENIKMYRKNQGLTQEQLAEAMGVTVGTISKWENGSFPDIETIVELADFFEVSVDVLLGYYSQSQSVRQCSEYIRSLKNEHKYEEGVQIVRKALKQYPNSFSVVYECGELIYQSAISKANFVNEDDWKEIRIDLMQAIEILEKAIALFDQNTDKKINREMIYQQIGSAYGFIGEKKKAIAYLEEHNIFHINDRMISVLLAEVRQYDKAWMYITKTFQSRITELWQCYLTIYTILINEHKYQKALEISEWVEKLCISIADEKESYFYKALAVTDALIATLYIHKAITENMDYTKEVTLFLERAFIYADMFDEHPEYHGKIRFFEVDADEINDSFGENAVNAVKNTILCSRDDKREFQLLCNIYNRVARKCNHEEYII